MSLMKIGDLFNLEKGSLQSSKNIEGEYNFITAAEEWKTNNEYSHECEALIFAAAASGSLGRTHYVNGKFITSDLCFIITPRDEDKYPIDLKFYHFVFNSLKEDIVKNTKTGTSKESINQGNLKNYKIPYFGIEQQHLWINKLLNTKSIKETLENEILNQQNLLTKLKQSILQEAIEGKLTANWREENQDIEPASVLVERIKAEKEQLIKEKKIKKSKSLVEISEEEILFNIPNNWEWCRLDNICFKITDGFHHTPKKIDRGNIYISATHIRENKIGWSECLYIGEKEHKELYKKAYPRKGEILITNRGAGCGTPAIIDIEEEFSFQNAALIGFNQTFLIKEYIYYFILFMRDQIMEHFVNGGLQPMLSNVMLGKLPISLPPLKEQKEIVNKIEKLFAICDELEEEINNSKQNTQTLMQAVLKEAFER